LKLQPYAQTSVVNQPCKKLAYRFYGPFEILEKIGQATYKLALPDNALIHLVFHVSRVKEHIPDHTPVFSDIPQIIDLTSVETIPELILERKLVKRGNNSHLPVLVKWSHHPASAAVWEDYETFRKRYPAAPAWGHAGSQGEGPVRYSCTDKKNLGVPTFINSLKLQGYLEAGKPATNGGQNHQK
jgi:hypothetical protein